MAKLVKNTTGSDIALVNVGLTIAASTTYTIEVSELPLWATEDAISEISPLVTGGSLIVNDGPFVIAEAGYLRAISVAYKTNQAATFSVRNNAVEVATLSIPSNANSGKVSGLSVALAENDELSVYVSSGSPSDVVLSLFIQVNL